MSKFIATFGFVGLIPFAPGTFGSLAALPFWYLLNALGGWVLILFGVILAFVLGVWATGEETRGAIDHDPGSIVIDEVAGQWLALLPVSLGLTQSGLALSASLIIGFALFRAFDILKPWPVSWADNMETPVGVMIDDIIAGALAAVCLVVIANLWGAIGV